MATSDRIRILAVDDHALFRQGIASVIKHQPDMLLAAEAANAGEAIQRFREHRPDVTLMDLRLPGMGGVEATMAIRKEFSDARIIVLTTFDGDEDIYRGLRAGAKAYLLKGAPCEELLETIRVVSTGQKCITVQVGEKLVERMEGQELTEHTSTQHASIQILTGECEFSLAGQPHLLKPGDLLYMPPNLRHAVKATRPFSMLLTLTKPADKPASANVVERKDPLQAA